MRFLQKVRRLYAQHWILLSTILGVIIIRALLLLTTPPGFYLDEAAGGAHIISMLTQGKNAHGEAWPLFSASLGGGYTTPIYLYPATAWAALFGASEYSLRAFSLFATVIAAILLVATMRLWTNTKTALITGITALTIPWGWIQGSIAWDPALVPAFVAGALFSFSVALKTTSKRRRFAGILMTGLCLIALAYLYPPCRVTAPLLLATFYGILLWQKKITITLLVPLGVGFAVLCIPLLQFMLQPDALTRSSELSVFHNVSMIEGVGRVIANSAQMISPMFLFVSGDSNFRHATGQQGMLGLAALPTLATLAYVGIRQVKQRRLRKFGSTAWLVVISLVGIGFSILGSALTNEGQPHSLRATAAWPFFVILIALGWAQILSWRARNWKITCVAFACLSVIIYAYDLSTNYPLRSADSFDVSQREQIKSGETPPNYPPLSITYYQQK